MSEDNVIELTGPEARLEDPLTEVLRAGARRLLAQAVESEVESFVAEHRGDVDKQGRPSVVSSGPRRLDRDQDFLR